MRHCIIGEGNLGHDLYRELTGYGPETESAVILSKGRGQDIRDPDFVRQLGLQGHDLVWYCVGYGSVKEADEQPDVSRFFHLDFPMKLVHELPEQTKIILFSSDYVADETVPHRPDRFNRLPPSRYASLKLQMERSVLLSERPGTTVVRVGSLYGTYRPERTFPGKVLRNLVEAKDRVALPLNVVTPTPTRWLARVLLDNRKRILGELPRLEHCAPAGNVTTREWGKLVLSGFKEKSDFDNRDFFDEQRPIISGLGCSFLKNNWNWLELWNTYFQAAWFRRDLPLVETPRTPRAKTPETLP